MEYFTFLVQPRLIPGEVCTGDCKSLFKCYV